MALDDRAFDPDWTGRRSSKNGHKIWSASFKERLCEAQNHRCCYCGVRMGFDADRGHSPTFEHVVPLSLGGPDDVSNIVIACRRCNEGRSQGEVAPVITPSAPPPAGYMWASHLAPHYRFPNVMVPQWTLVRLKE